MPLSKGYGACRGDRYLLYVNTFLQIYLSINLYMCGAMFTSRKFLAGAATANERQLLVIPHLFLGRPRTGARS